MTTKENKFGFYPDEIEKALGEATKNSGFSGKEPTASNLEITRSPEVKSIDKPPVIYDNNGIPHLKNGS